MKIILNASGATHLRSVLTAFALFLCGVVSPLHAAPLPGQLGDLNSDGTLDVRDLVLLLNHLSGKNEFRLVPNLLPYADVNEDGYLNQADVTMLRDAILGIPLPVNTRPVVLEPATGSSDVGVTVRPKAIFPKPIDIATLNSNNFYATFARRRLAATITPANNGSFAWLFFHEPMPNASQIQVTVDGSTLRTRTGLPLDADGDGAFGGVMRFNFGTVSVAPIPGTVLSSRIVDPGPDLIPRTADDVRLGNGFTYLLPVAGVRVHVLGMENNVAYTDADGRFTLTNMPVGDVKMVLDGRTATNPPAGYYFPEMVMDTTFEPGITNGVMNIVDANGNVVRDPNGVPIRALAMYLPRVASNVLQTVSASVTNLITLQSNAAYTLPPEQQQYLTVEIMPGSLIGMDGQPLSAGQVGVSVVPPELVRDMLPPGLLQHTFDITVQAPGIATFSTPAPMTFPNVFNAPPGTKLNFLSFDHTTGRLVFEGTATVSEDGMLVRTDAGNGITHPGWHGLTPPGGPSGPPPPPHPRLPRPPCRDPEVAATAEADCRQRASDTRWRAKKAALRQALLTEAGCTAAAIYLCTTSPLRCSEAFALEVVCLAKAIADQSAKNTDAYNTFLKDLENCQIRNPCYVAPGSRLSSLVNLAIDPDSSPLIFADPVLEQIQTQQDNIETVLSDSNLTPVQVHDRIRTILIRMESIVGGDPIAYLRESIIQTETALGLDGTEEQPQQKPYPVFYVASILQTNGETFKIRGRTEGGGQYQVFIAQNDGLQNVRFYDPLTKEVGIAFPYLNPTARYGLPHPTWYKLDTGAPDADGDQLADFIEDVYGTSESKSDTDDDGLSDWAEVEQGLDPLSGRGFPTGVIASLPLPGEAKEVVLEGSILDSQQQTAYLALGTRGLGIVNASQFQNPILLGQLDLPGDATDVAVDSNLRIAAVAGSAGGLHIVNVADPMQPTLVQTIPGVVNQVEVVNGVAYAAFGASIRAYLLTGELLETLALNGGTITGLAREGFFLYSMDSSLRLCVVDFSGPNMTARGTLTMPAGGGKLFIGNGVAYVAAGDGRNGGFSTVDVADPENLRLISGVDGANIEGGVVVANGSGLAIAVGSIIGPTGPIPALDLVSVLDLQNTAAFVTRFNLPASPFSAAIGAGIALVADGTAGLQVVNYRNFDSLGVPPTITLSNSFAMTSPTNGETEEGKLVLLSARTTDDVQVRNVEFYVDGVKVATDVSFPFEHRFITPTLSGTKSNFTVRARAIDTGGNFAWTDEINVALTPDSNPPGVVGVFPPSGSTMTNPPIVCRFSEPMNVASLNHSTLELVSAGRNGVLGDADDFLVTNGLISYREEANTAIMQLDPATLGTLQATIRPPLADRSGNVLASAFTWQFHASGPTTIVGRVVDTNGLPIVRAIVRIFDSAAGPVTTDANGDFVIANVSTTLGSLFVSVRLTVNGQILMAFARVNGVPGGTTATGSIVARILDASSQSRFAAGVVHTVALQRDGTLWAWGNNEFGQLGNGIFLPISGFGTNTPQPIQRDVTWQTVAAGALHTAAIREDGTLWTWGDNLEGQLGIGSFGSLGSSGPNTPQAIATNMTWKAIAAGGSHTVAIREDGTLWTWGSNGRGELGNGTYTYTNTPQAIATNTTWKAIAPGGSHTVAIREDGTLWTWGSNGRGELGNGTYTYTNTPQAIATNMTWKAVAAGGSYTVAIREDGTLWAWGANEYGQLGNGRLIRTNTPQPILTNATWKAVAAGNLHTVALREDGTLWTWGTNSLGQLGSGDPRFLKLANTPQAIRTNETWQAIAAGGNHTMALTEDGTLWTWGDSDAGQLGNRAVKQTDTPQPILTNTSWRAVAAGDGHAMAVDDDGILWTWGSNSEGELGDGTFGRFPNYGRATPQPIVTNSTWKAVAAGYAHTVALREDGTLWTWGFNYDGQLGNSTDGTDTSTNTPQPILTNVTWNAVAAGSGYTMALREDGTLWAWGRNSSGMLGNGSDTSTNTPQPILANIMWKVVAAGDSYLAALQSDGTLWTWGYNFYGQLGNGTYTSTNTPQAIASNMTWKAVAAGDSHTVAIREDGTLWEWGAVLAHIGFYVYTNTPRPVLTNAQWKAVAQGVSHTVVLREDGTLWTWGDNTFGELGVGSRIRSISIPELIQADITWKAVSAGRAFTLAIRSDGTLWAWGDNADGQLGLPVPWLPSPVIGGAVWGPPR